MRKDLPYKKSFIKVNKSFVYWTAKTLRFSYKFFTELIQICYKFVSKFLHFCMGDLFAYGGNLIFSQGPPSKNRKQKCNCILNASYTWLPVSYHHLMSLLFKALRLWTLSPLVKMRSIWHSCSLGKINTDWIPMISAFSVWSWIRFLNTAMNKILCSKIVPITSISAISQNLHIIDWFNFSF